MLNILMNVHTLAGEGSVCDKNVKAQKPAIVEDYSTWAISTKGTE
jgi:hypothetical protein